MSIYSDVKDLLNDKTWVKGTPFDNFNGNIAMCLLGARAFVADNILEKSEYNYERIYHDNEFTDKLAKIIKEQFSDRVNPAEISHEFQYVTLFNDHNATTIADIHLILEKADADV